MEKGIGVVLVAAGAGERMGRPKALLELKGLTLLERAAAPFAAFGDRVAVLRAEDLEACALPGWTKVAGGARRRDSVAAGLDALRPDTTTVLIHDAARPLLPAAVLERIVSAAETAPAVIPVIAVPDTIKRVRGDAVAETLDRSPLRAVQTPQAFSVALLRRALAATDDDATDDAALVEALGEKVRTVPGDPRNFKVTTPLDLELARMLLP